jgi:hypothetical protein
MTRTPASTARPAFTLLEMVLAASITVLLLAALYVAVDIQLRHAATARDVVEQSTLARTLMNRIANDIEPSVNIGDPTRYQQAVAQQQAAANQSGTGTGGTGASSTGAAASSTGASGTSGTGGGAAAGGTGSSSSSSTSTNGPPLFMLQGTTDTLTIWISRVPYNPNGTNNPNDPNSFAGAPSGFSDTRRIDYWLAGGGGLGLARMEQTNLTDDDVLPGNSPPDVSDAGSKLIIAPEVKSLQFQYFDGASWQDSWDGTQTGADGITPLGPPAAVAVTIGLAPADGGDVKSYRHVIAIQTANGSTAAQISSADGATTTVTTASSSGGGSASSASSSSSSGGQ